MVRTAPDFTITFAGDEIVEDIVQLEGIVQSPDEGGPHDNDCTDESTLILGNESPLPESDIDLAVLRRSDRIADTDKEGFFSFKMAIAPDTAGAEKDVPLPVPIPPPGIEDVTDSPGAIRLRNDALSEKVET